MSTKLNLSIIFLIKLSGQREPATIPVLKF